MKILLTIPNFDTAGSGKVLYDLAVGLLESGEEVEIACIHDKGAFFQKVNDLGCPVHVMDFLVEERPWITFPFRALRRARWFKKKRFDIVHSWHYTSDFTEPLVARLGGAKFIYTKKAMSWGNPRWKLRNRLSNRIIYINSDMKREFFPDHPRTSFIPIGIDIEEYSPENQFDWPLDVPKYDESDFVFVSIANLVPVKGIEIAIEALKRCQDSRFKYLIVGNNQHDYGDKLKDLVDSYGLNEQIHFIDKVMDVRPYLACGDVFIIPTKNEGRKEGQPIAPVEAMASGLIVTGSKIPGVVDILEDFQELIFDSGDIEGLKEIMLELFNLSEEDRKTISQKMREKVIRDYDKKIFVDRHLELYRSLI